MKTIYVCPLCFRKAKTAKPDPFCDEGHIPIEMDAYFDEDSLELAASMGCGC